MSPISIPGKVTLKQQTNPAIVTDGLVLHLDAGNLSSYPGTGTTWTDLSGNGNNGTLNGVPTPTYDSSNLGSIGFDGSNHYGTILDDNSLTSTTSLTINCWVKATAFNSTYSSLVGKGTADTNEEYAVLFHSSFLYFDVGSGGPLTQPSYTFNTDTWYNICCTHTRTSGSSSLLCYVNGVFLNNSTTRSTDPVNDNSFPVSIGSRYHNSITRPLSGNLAQVSIYNKALTSTEVTQNYSALKWRFGL